MASFNITGFSTTTQTLLTGETGFITEFGNLSPDTTTPVTMADGILIVEGSILARASGVSAVSFTGIPDIYIGAGGSIMSARTSAIISSDFSFINITNDGTLYGRQAAVSLFGGTAHFINTGTIQSSNTSAMSLSGTGLRLENAGDIMGSGNGISAFGAVGARIFNSGLISSGGFGDSIATGTAGDRVFNSGTLNGEVSLSGGDDLFNGASGIQTDVLGSEGNDTLIGGAGAESLFGGSENDLLIGNGGDDSLSGGSGNDLIKGGLGEDTLTGEAQDDTLFGHEGIDSLSGGTENDQLFGGADDDTLQGDTGNDLLTGGSGDDLLTGGDGKDTLRGGEGNDALDGGAGLDAINGGSGDDTLTGGTEADTFFFNIQNGFDTITDFADNVDKLNLRPFDMGSLGAVIAVASDSTLGLRIDLTSFGGGTITLDNFTLAQLSAQDVLL